MTMECLMGGHKYLTLMRVRRLPDKSAIQKYYTASVRICPVTCAGTLFVIMRGLGLEAALR
jgi:hypothetical protein